MKSVGWSTNSIDSIYAWCFIRLTLHGAVPTTTDGISNPKNEDVNVRLLLSGLNHGAKRLNIPQ